ncbi:MAG: ATP-binding protein [Bacteroidales bacterium]|nr:ATP-binding protein [Bacteroidales bacterium]
MIIVVFGLPGTGKSCLARHLAEDTRALYLNTDITREMLNKQGKYDKETKREVYEKILEEITRPDAQRRTVIVDGTFSNKSFRHMFNKRSWELERYLYYIELKAADHEVKKRMKKDRAYSEADYSVYKKMKAAFDYMPEQHLVMRSDKLGINEMKEKAKALFNGKRTDSATVRDMQVR